MWAFVFNRSCLTLLPGQSVALEIVYFSIQTVRSLVSRPGLSLCPSPPVYCLTAKAAPQLIRTNPHMCSQVRAGVLQEPLRSLGCYTIAFSSLRLNRGQKSATACWVEGDRRCEKISRAKSRSFSFKAK